tara:strand:+ start:22 stop:609 length:588 start_codon:yes stop_codon:yes gene_type:complete
MIESKLISNSIFTDISFNNLEELLVQTRVKSHALMDQTHSDKVIHVKEAGSYKSDGIFTSNKNLGLVVRTADCMPVLIKDNSNIGAVHIGWRGVKNKIINNAIRHFKLSDLLMSVGPHAQSCCYEVKEDVNKYLYKYINTRKGKKYLDMSQSLKDLSNEIGFQIEVSTICTICDNSYNSYRENKTIKRQYGFIWI